MNINDISASTQDYLKAIWNLAEWRRSPIPPSQIAERLQVSAAAVSTRMKKLRAQGLVTVNERAAVSLTDEGRALALAMVRRHRLIETFLARTLDYPWDEVHPDAERLEHAASDRFIERLDALLDYPTRDPHGDPIPRADGSLPSQDLLSLAEAPLHTPLVVQRVGDGDAEFLRALDEAGIRVGTTVISSGPDQLTDGLTVTLADSGNHHVISASRSAILLVGLA